jgi:FMN-dependent NADH-azoreductase
VSETETKPINLLRIDSSLSLETSISRSVADKLQARLKTQRSMDVIYRDVTEGIPLITPEWVIATRTLDDDRTDEHWETLKFSGELVDEVLAADVLLISSPVYNFGITANLKAWIDNICRARLTFQYTEHGPRGLLENKKAYVVLASGGTGIGSDIDFAGRYLKQILVFLNITDVTIIAADQLLKFDPEPKLVAVDKEISELVF